MTAGHSEPISLTEHVDRHCLACGSPKVAPLAALHVEGAPPSTPGHVIAYEHDLVVGCRACGALRLESWRHDCFDFESSFDRHWYSPIADDAADLSKPIRSR